MSAKRQEKKSNNNFELRMSKKIAELTQIVHALFTRNQEKEIQMEALKKCYEQKFQLTMEDARSRISKLEATVLGVRNKGIQDVEEFQRIKDRDIAIKENEWRQKFGESEHLLQEERRECQNLRDLLISAQKDLDKFRQDVTVQNSFQSQEIIKREKGVEKLRAQILSAESNLKESQRNSQSIIKELQAKNEKLTRDWTQLHNVIDTSHKARDQLLTRNKQLERHVKTLKIELSKKLLEMIKGQTRSSKATQCSESNEEVERLRLQVQKYRLELSNRDCNFNRMFTEKQPILLSQRRKFSHKRPERIHQSAGTFSTGSNQTNMQFLLKERIRPQQAEILPLKQRETFAGKRLNRECFKGINCDKRLLSTHLRGRIQKQPMSMSGNISAQEKTLAGQIVSSSVNTEESCQNLPLANNVSDVDNMQSKGTSDSKGQAASNLPSLCPSYLSIELTRPKPLSRAMLSRK